MKNIKQITDEDFLTFISIVDPELAKETEAVLEHKEQILEVMTDVNAEVAGNEYHPLLWLKSFQYLESQGYEIPKYY